ncbi:hypothetical protein GCM10019016_020930 [Streptomyces prasinosporus]|uniref:Uncharacterized protein n=1 Tax=Streptomyces prasinosporus TaxID=68256 RepID=A0ABP6TJS1_9ACTN
MSGDITSRIRLVMGTSREGVGRVFPRARRVARSAVRKPPAVRRAGAPPAPAGGAAPEGRGAAGRDRFAPGPPRPPPGPVPAYTAPGTSSVTPFSGEAGSLP